MSKLNHVLQKTRSNEKKNGTSELGRKNIESFIPTWTLSKDWITCCGREGKNFAAHRRLELAFNQNMMQTTKNGFAPMFQKIESNHIWPS